VWRKSGCTPFFYDRVIPGVLFPPPFKFTRELGFHRSVGFRFLFFFSPWVLSPHCFFFFFHNTPLLCPRVDPQRGKDSCCLRLFALLFPQRTQRTAFYLFGVPFFQTFWFGESVSVQLPFLNLVNSDTLPIFSKPPSLSWSVCAAAGGFLILGATPIGRQPCVVFGRFSRVLIVPF